MRVHLYFRIGHKVISLCYDMGLASNIVICYGKPQITVTMDRGHSYIRMLVFPRRPVTGKPPCNEISSLLCVFSGFKQLYDSDTRPPMFCAACELAGCVILLGMSNTGYISHLARNLHDNVFVVCLSVRC